jgi:hypothetical protein
MLEVLGLYVGVVLLGWCFPQYILMHNPSLTNTGWVSPISALAFALISQYYIFGGSL